MSAEQHKNLSGHPGRERLRALVEEMGCCPAGTYCIHKEILARAHRDSRMLMQLRCIEKFKYERSERAGCDIGWNHAMELWVSEGRAEGYAHHYREDLNFKELYHAIMQEPEHHDEKP